MTLEIVGNDKVKDRTQKGFLVASHEEAIEEGPYLVVDCVGFGVQPVEPVYHAENEATQDARRMGAVRRQVHVQIEGFLVKRVRNSAIFDSELKVEEN